MTPWSSNDFRWNYSRCLLISIFSLWNFLGNYRLIDIMNKCVIRKQTHSCLDFIISKVPGSNQQSKFYHFQFTFILWIYQDPAGTIFIIGDITKIRFQKTKLGGTLHSQSVSCVLCAHTIALFFCKSLFFFSSLEQVFSHTGTHEQTNFHEIHMMNKRILNSFS